MSATFTQAPTRPRSEAERIGGPSRFIRARPWPERPVSAANKSGEHAVATRVPSTYSCSLLADRFRPR